MDLAVNFLADLSKLKLSTEDLVLVLPLDNIQLLNSLIPSSLQPEELAVVVAALLLACFNLSNKVINLGLPFSNNLVKVLSTALSDDGSSMDSFVFKLQLLQLSLQTMLG